MSAPLFGGDMTAQLAALLLQSSLVDRKQNREMRREAEAVQRAAEDKEIAAMHAQAEHIRSAGQWEGAGMALSGAAQVGGSFCSNTPAGPSPAAMRWNAGSKAAEGLGRWQAGEANADAKLDEANAKHESQMAGHAKSAVDDAKDGINEANDLSKKILEFYKEMRGKQHETSMAAVKR
jgi:hypothetical protein